MKYQPFKDEPYQRECADRYKPIKEMCSSYKRPFSVLDIGANHGWFGQQLVKDFPHCTYVAVDNKEIEPHPRIWHIKRHLDSPVLATWSCSDQFDIVLMLSVLHHFPDPGMAFNATKRLGTWAFYEIPGKDDEGTLNPENHQRIRDIFGDNEPLETFKSHKSGVERPMFLQKSTPFITEQSLDAAHRGAQGYASYKLFQDFNASLIEINRMPVDPIKEIRPFIPGMNMHNFELLSGQKVEYTQKPDHPDDQPWNYVISHDGIQPIDFIHKQHGNGTLPE